MSNEKNGGKISSAENSDPDNAKKTGDQQSLPFHNPLQTGNDKQITHEDIENEQKYKEALSERD